MRCAAHRTGQRAASVALALALASASGSARADDPEPDDADTVDQSRAVQLFQESAERYRQGRFLEAADLLREAYRLKNEPLLTVSCWISCIDSARE